MKKLLTTLALLALLAVCVTAALATVPEYTTTNGSTSYLIFPTGPIDPAPSPSPTPLAGMYVEFKRDSAVYKKAGSGKTGVVILKGSTAYANQRSKDKKWVKIIYGADYKKEGWVPFKALRKASKDYPLIDYAAKSSSNGARTDLSGASKLAGLRFKVRKAAKLFSTGSSGGDVLAKLKKGRAVTATGKLKVDSSGVFYVQVSYKGKTGWMSEKALSGASSAINKAILK